MRPPPTPAEPALSARGRGRGRLSPVPLAPSGDEPAELLSRVPRAPGSQGKFAETEAGRRESRALSASVCPSFPAAGLLWVTRCPQDAERSRAQPLSTLDASATFSCAERSKDSKLPAAAGASASLSGLR